MMFKSFGFKIFIFVILSISISCSNSVENSQTIKQSESKVGVIQVTPTPLLGKTAQIRGEYAPIKIAENLKDSVEQQELPKVWLEFEKENGEKQRVELNEEFKERLNTNGKLLFNYQYVINNSENPDERFNAAYSKGMFFVNTLNDLREMEINAPEERRKLTEEEASEILRKQSGLVNDRYFELDDQFKPKSAFYNFKKSVNEKLGYQIF